MPKQVFTPFTPCAPFTIEELLEAVSDYEFMLREKIKNYFKTSFPDTCEDWQMNVQSDVDGAGSTRRYIRVRVATRLCPNSPEHYSNWSFSAHSFIDTQTGFIHKCAGYKAPEKKNPRGSVFSESHGAEAIGNGYHIRYL